MDMQTVKTEKTVQQRQLSLMRVQSALLAAILVILLLAGIFLAGKISELQSVMDVIEQDVKALDMDALNDAVAALTEAADQLAAVDVGRLNDTVAALKDAAKTLSEIDMKGINKAVTSLTEAANHLKDVDIGSLNSLVQSLETVASKLQKATDSISGLFKR